MIGTTSTIDRVVFYIDSHLESELRREEIAAHVHYHVDYLTRMFKKEKQISMKEYIIRQKMLKAQTLLQNTNLPVSQIATRLGYQNLSHFSFAYKKTTGRSPMEDRLSTLKAYPL